MALHLIVTQLFTTYLPQGLVTYAPTILLALLVLLLLVGALKIVVGAILATVNPLIGAFYTFFFATIVGKALSKAMLTALLLLHSAEIFCFLLFSHVFSAFSHIPFINNIKSISI